MRSLSGSWPWWPVDLPRRRGRRPLRLRGLGAPLLFGVAVVVCLIPIPATPAVASGRMPLTAAVQDTSQIRRRSVQDTGQIRRAQRRFPSRTEGDSVGVIAPTDSVPPGEAFPVPDSVMRTLLQRPGYRPVVYRGDTLEFRPEGRQLRIRERAQLERAGEQLFASDSVVYSGDTRRITAYGESRLINAEGEEVTSEEGPFFYDTDLRIGTVMNGRTQWEVWNVRGNFTLEGNDTLWVREGVFTSCDLPEPHYYFAADRIKLILGHIVVAWPVRLYFGDVPVFWLPFFAQDVRQGRHSGILTPRFGINDVVRNSRNHNRHISNIGYYWAISDYMDAQIGLDWWSDRWTRLDGFYRYRWRRKFLSGRLGYSQFFLPEGEQQLSLAWNHSQKFGERSDLRASVQFVSSQTFQRENEFNPERLTQQIRSDVGFTRRFDWGTLNLSGQRIQPLTEGGRTTLDLPQASLTLSPLVFFPASSPLERRWYNGLTLNGSGNFSRQQVDVDSPDQPDQSSVNASLSTSLSLGNLRSSQSASFREEVQEKPDTLIAPIDTTIVNGDTLTRDTTVIGPEVREGTIDWRTSVGYQQRLIGSTTITPALQLNGVLFRSNETGLEYISGPTRVSMNASLNTDVFGFFPGFGPVQRIRHKFSPRFNWSYSPAVQPSAEVEALQGFNPSEIDERHQLSLTLAQTFEAKLKPQRRPADEGPDTTRTEVEERARRITLLAIRTTPLTYNFVTGELITDRLSNNITSDLLRGLTVRIAHDLFEETEDGGRNFDPFLTELNLSFSLGDRTVAGLFGDRTGGLARDRGVIPQAREFEDLEEPPEEVEGRPAERAEPGPRRPWNLSLDYSLVRSRPLPGSDPRPTRQSIRANLGFSPTENWTVSWRTQYDIEEGEFVDHVLSLRRDLHRWSANFDFLRAANGNFLFEFRVNLSDLPDLKFDYRQETRRSQVR